MSQTVRTLQAVSGVTLASFVGLHLATHISFLWGPDAFNHSLKIFRVYYQNPIMEFFVLPAAALVHITCGGITSQKRGPYASLLDRLFAYSGWFLALSIGFHAYMKRANALMYGPKFEADFNLVTATFIKNGTPGFYSFMLPYVAAGTLHMSLGLIRAAGVLKVVKQQTALDVRRSRLTAALVTSLVGLVVYSVYTMAPDLYWPTDPNSSLKFWNTMYTEGPEAALKL